MPRRETRGGERTEPAGPAGLPGPTGRPADAPGLPAVVNRAGFATELDGLRAREKAPRFRGRDRYVYRSPEHAVTALGDTERRDLTDFLRGQELPVSATRSRRVLEWFLLLVAGRLRASPDGLLHADWHCFPVEF